MNSAGLIELNLHSQPEVPSFMAKEKIRLDTKEITQKSAEILTDPKLEQDSIGNRSIEMESVSLKADHHINNQDSSFIYLQPEGRFFCAAVYDGVGGASGGGVASAAFNQYMQKRLELVGGQEELSTKDVLEALKTGATQAHDFMKGLAKNKEMYKYSSTTISLAFGYFDEESQDYVIYTVNAGDSRVYGFEDRKLNQLTKDDSVIQGLLDQHAVTIFQAKTDNLLRHTLTASGMGMGTIPNVNSSDEYLKSYPYRVEQFRLKPGSELLLTTDGFSDQFREDYDMNEPEEYMQDGLAAVDFLAAARIRSRSKTVADMSKEDDTTIIKVQLRGAAKGGRIQQDVVVGQEKEIDQDEIITEPDLTEGRNEYYQQILNSMKDDYEVRQVLSYFLYDDILLRDEITPTDLAKFYKNFSSSQVLRITAKGLRFSERIEGWLGEERRKEYEGALERFIKIIYPEDKFK